MTRAALPRFDLYATIHKTLRLAMAETLASLGSLDADDPGPRQGTIEQLRLMLDLCRAHVEKEERYVHPAIESRCPGLLARTEADHRHHLADLDALEARVVSFQCAPEAASAFQLYRHVARFVADNLQHMELEESIHNPVLWALFRDDELLEIHRTIVASLEREQMTIALHWMLPAMHHAERLGMLQDMRAHAPPAAWEEAMRIAQRRLPPSSWARLAHAFEWPAAMA